MKNKKKAKGKKYIGGNCSGGPVVKEPLAPAGDTVGSLVWEDHRRCRKLSLCATTVEPACYN